MTSLITYFISMNHTYPVLGIDKDQENLHHLSGLKPPQSIDEGPLYEIYVRAFSDEGDFKSVESHLPYLKAMNIKTIWLMPVYPIGEKGRKGTLGSPYSIRDYFDVNPEYGTMDDLKNLIKKVHESDMKIIVDMVANHVSNDYVEMKNHPEMFARDDQGKFTREVADWSDVTDLNYDHPYTRKYMHNVLKFWIEEAGFDGYRCDVAGMVPLDFWENNVPALLKIKPDLYMLAEWESNEHHVNAFHSTYDWTLYHLLKDVKNSKKPVSDALKWVEEKRLHYPLNALPMRFIENHDEERAAKVFGIEGQKPFAVFIFSMYGIPLIYAGQEFGETKKPSLFEKSVLNWPAEENDAQAFYKTLTELRKTYPAFVSREMIILDNNKSEKVFSYIKKSETQEILFLLNTSDKELDIRIDSQKYKLQGSYSNLMYDSSVNFKDNSVLLHPYQSVIVVL